MELGMIYLATLGRALRASQRHVAQSKQEPRGRYQLCPVAIT